MAWRPLLGLACAAAASALGALILGEYEFTGTLPLMAGPLFGLAIGEIVVGVGRTRAVAAGVAAAGIASGGLAWAGWIDSTQGLEPVKGLAWVAAAIGAATALLRIVGLRRQPSRH